MKQQKLMHGSSTGNSFAPLRQSVFAVLWVATIVGNTGSFVRDVASAWLMTELTSSPAAIALVQAAATLPVFLLAIPAGVLADILDRRKFLIGIQVLLGCTSLTMMLFSVFQLHSVVSLVALTFLGGTGAALMGPTWQAIVPELVNKNNLKNAIVLNSLGINIARAVGPALGGVVLAKFGAAYTYGVDVISYVFVIAALLWWPRLATQPDVLTERFWGAFRAGLRYARSSRDLRLVLIRTFIFFILASSVWALLPLVARQLLGGDSGFYGMLLGSVGLGAIAGAFILPHLRTRLSSDSLLLAASWITAAVMYVLSMAPTAWVSVSVLFILGISWITALTTLNSIAQAILPNWVRGRSLAIYLTVLNGAMTLGSLIWGLIAEESSLELTLQLGAAGLVIIGGVTYCIRLPMGKEDLTPSEHWSEPFVSAAVIHERGPVLIQIEYKIDDEHRSMFLKAIRRLSYERYRDGAYSWGVAEDTTHPGIILEWFFVESWAEHMRQHKRVTRSDASIQQEVLSFHKGEHSPVVRHLLGFR